MLPEQIVKLGECHRPHGLRGGMVFHLYNQQRPGNILTPGQSLQIGPLGLPPAQTHKLVQISWGAKVVGYFQGINDRTTVELLMPFGIWLARSTFLPLGPEEYYLVDLIGLSDYRHQTTIAVGKVVDFYHNGPGDQVVVVVQQEHLRWELPLVQTFFPVLDCEQGRLEVIWPLPEYLE